MTRNWTSRVVWLAYKIKISWQFGMFTQKVLVTFVFDLQKI